MHAKHHTLYSNPLNHLIRQPLDVRIHTCHQAVWLQVHSSVLLGGGVEAPLEEAWELSSGDLVAHCENTDRPRLHEKNWGLGFRV